MLQKLQWPSVTTPIVDNICKYNLILGMYIVTTLTLINKGYEPPSDTLKAFF